jgi:hypothetical protein
MAYEKVNNQDGAVWYPSQKFKDGVGTDIESSKETYVEGYFLGTKEVKTKNGASNIHSFKLIKAGNPDSIKVSEGGPISEGDDVSVWGSMILDEAILKNATPGVKTMIHWEGKKKALTGGNSYNVFGVYFDKAAEPFGGGPAPMELTQNQEPQKAADVMAGDKNDKLPF